MALKRRSEIELTPHLQSNTERKKKVTMTMSNQCRNNLLKLRKFNLRFARVFHFGFGAFSICEERKMGVRIENAGSDLTMRKECIMNDCAPQTGTLNVCVRPDALRFQRNCAVNHNFVLARVS